MKPWGIKTRFTAMRISQNIIVKGHRVKRGHGSYCTFAGCFFRLDGFCRLELAYRPWFNVVNNETQRGVLLQEMLCGLTWSAELLLAKLALLVVVLTKSFIFLFVSCGVVFFLWLFILTGLVPVQSLMRYQEFHFYLWHVLAPHTVQNRSMLCSVRKGV